MSDGHDNELEGLRRRVAELEAAETQLRSLIGASPDAVVMADLQGRVLIASQHIAEILGLDPKDVSGRRIEDFVVPGDHQRLANNLSALIESGSRRNTEYTAIRRDGATVPVEVSSAVIPAAGDRPGAVMAVIRDISARKAVEEALRQSLDELRGLYGATVEGMIIVDIETAQCVRANAQMARMLGYSLEELPKESSAVHRPEDIPALVEQFRAQVEGRLPLAENVPFLHRDGSVVYTDITGSRIVFGGRPCLLSVVRDVTGRKRTQEALERERQTLRHMLHASDHERQLIAYEIHDGLAQQLAAALMHFESCGNLALQSGTATAAHATGVQLLRQAHAEARRLISGVRPPILDESGITAAIAHLVHEQREAGNRVIDFTSRVSFDRLPAILENAIYRIAQEALANACKHSQSDRVQVSLVQENDTVRIEVQDWGIGFDPRTDATDRFGLESIRERVRLLGGQVALESQPGRGTRVNVALPLMPEDPSTAPGPATAILDEPSKSIVRDVTSGPLPTRSAGP